MIVHATDVLAGGERSILALVRHLNRAAFLPRIICDSTDEFLQAGRESGTPIDCLRFPGLRRPGLAVWRAARDLAARCEAMGGAIIHANTPRTNLYAALAGRMARIPVVWHCRNLLGAGMWDTDKWFAWAPDQIICNSAAIAARFAKSPWQDRVAVIFSGVDLEEFHPKLSGSVVRTELNWEDRPIFATTSRLDPEKGHDTLLEAMRKVLASRPEARLLIAGRASADPVARHAALERRIRELGLSGAVRLLGFRRDIPQLLAAADVCVLPAEAEACGRVLFEAMAMAKPVVATASGGTPEIVFDGVTGILVPPRDSEAMASALLTLTADRARARAMGAAGRDRAEQHFSIQAHAHKIMDVYTDVLARRGTGRFLHRRRGT
jgi:glycosyltransferase involved in cell wall biosynthesis